MPSPTREAAATFGPQTLPAGTRLLDGEDGIATMVSDPEVDVVVTAIVGAAGLTGTWPALEAGKTVAVANKETLVMAGPLVMELARQRNGRRPAGRQRAQRHLPGDAGGPAATRSSASS